MGELEAILDVKELGTLSVTCPKCNNQVLYNAATDPVHGYPTACQACGSEWEWFRRIFETYRRFIEVATTPKTPVSVRVRVPGSALH